MFTYTPKTKLMCVSYTDECSAGNKSMNDLMISFNRGILAAGSKRLATFDACDIVIVTATDEHSRKCFVARITAPVDTPFQDWVKEGGRVWEYNFTIDPISDIIDITNNNELSMKIKQKCRDMNQKENNMFNSRFCSEKLIGVLSECFHDGLIMYVENRKLVCRK